MHTHISIYGSAFRIRLGGDGHLIIIKRLGTSPMKMHPGKGYPFSKTIKQNPVIPAKEQGRMPNQGCLTVSQARGNF